MGKVGVSLEAIEREDKLSSSFMQSIGLYFLLDLHNMRFLCQYIKGIKTNVVFLWVKIFQTKMIMGICSNALRKTISKILTMRIGLNLMKGP